MVSNGGVDLGRQTRLHGAVGEFFNNDNAVLVLRPDIVGRDISCKDGEADIGNLGDVLQQILSQLDWRVTLVITPGGG